MSVKKDGVQVAFSLLERVERKRHIPTSEELEKDKRRQHSSSWSFERAYPEWDFVRTGQLSIEIKNEYLDGYRRSWRDGKTRLIEQELENVADGILIYALGIIERQKARERRERNWARLERVRARAAKRREREEKRSKVLDRLTAISAEASKIRAWLKEASDWPPPEQENEFTSFVRWAEARLEQLTNSVTPEGIADLLKAENLFPAEDPLVDPPEDLTTE